MATETPESRYPLALTERQLRALTGYLDSVSTSEADPDAEVFVLIDQVRQVRKQIATAAIAPVIQIEQDNPELLSLTRAEMARAAESVRLSYGKAESLGMITRTHESGVMVGYLNALVRGRLLSHERWLALLEEWEAALRDAQANA
jgi:hypothetical protein